MIELLETSFEDLLRPSFASGVIFLLLRCRWLVAPLYDAVAVSRWLLR
jgi:hypothetical protein